MSEIRALPEHMKQPVRIQVELTDEHWSWVMGGHAEVKLIEEDGRKFIVEYPTRVEYEREVQRWCDLVKHQVIQ